jgi:NAD(P)-dependent dehydrogenase (short-subunit alcohol dehydrogenase family)
MAEYTHPTAVVTGAGGAIGSEIVRALLARGARVAAVDRDLGAVDRHFGDDDRVLGVAADLSNEDDVAALAATVRDRFGTISMIANNAGVEGPVAPITDTSADEFDRVIAVNVRAPFLVLKHLLPLVQDGGSIVNTSSALGLVGAPGLSPYITSKHAIIGLTKVAALEGAARGIRANAVCPGPIEGRMIEALEAAIFGDSGTTFASVVPLGRHGKPAEIADFIAYLLSADAAYITGTAHSIDGGMVAQ